MTDDTPELQEILQLVTALLERYKQIAEDHDQRLRILEEWQLKREGI